MKILFRQKNKTCGHLFAKIAPQVSIFTNIPFVSARSPIPYRLLCAVGARKRIDEPHRRRRRSAVLSAGMTALLPQFLHARNTDAPSTCAMKS